MRLSRRIVSTYHRSKFVSMALQNIYFCNLDSKLRGRLKTGLFAIKTFH